MLTRDSKSRDGTSPEACYVVGRAKVGRPDASSVRTSRSVRSRQVGSDTKRAHTDGLPATFPRGDSEDANLGASRPKGPEGSNAHVLPMTASEGQSSAHAYGRCVALACRGRARNRAEEHQPATSVIKVVPPDVRTTSGVKCFRARDSFDREDESLLRVGGVSPPLNNWQTNRSERQRSVCRGLKPRPSTRRGSPVSGRRNHRRLEVSCAERQFTTTITAQWWRRRKAPCSTGTRIGDTHVDADSRLFWTSVRIGTGPRVRKDRGDASLPARLAEMTECKLTPIRHRDVWQLVADLLWVQEVGGSSPPISTRYERS